METKYRLLDVGEHYLDEDEMLTVSRGWQNISVCGGTMQEHTLPTRRLDDGKGKYVVCERSESAEFWKWGSGWMEYSAWKYAKFPDGTVSIWRRLREVEQAQLKNEMAGRPWVTFCEESEEISYFKTEMEVLDYLRGEELVQEQHYHIAKIVKTVVVKMIVKEVGL